jgi:hypothetical protein
MITLMKGASDRDLLTTKLPSFMAKDAIRPSVHATYCTKASLISYQTFGVADENAAKA